MIFPDKLEEARVALSSSLASDEMVAVSSQLPKNVEETISWARALWKSGAFPPAAAKDLARAGRAVSARASHRFLLIRHSLHSLASVPDLPVDEKVKTLLCGQYRFFATPNPESLYLLAPDSYSYRAFTGMSLLERFPAGVLDSEETGFPRSWLARVPKKDLVPLISFLLFRMRGLRPLWFPHTAFLRGKVPFMRERDWDHSMVLILKSMRLQPAVKGILTGSWFYSPETHRVTPHLSWTTRTFLENGAFLTNIGPADPGAGFLQGSKQRQELYDAGEYHPTETILLWPREDALKWLDRFLADGRKTRT